MGRYKPQRRKDNEVGSHGSNSMCRLSPCIEERLLYYVVYIRFSFTRHEKKNPRKTVNGYVKKQRSFEPPSNIHQAPPRNAKRKKRSPRNFVPRDDNLVLPNLCHRKQSAAIF